jgi:hypothetical protein
MPDSEAKKLWMKQNSRMYSIKVMRRTESDILEFLESQEKPISTIKEAIRFYMEHKKAEEQG